MNGYAAMHWQPWSSSRGKSPTLFLADPGEAWNDLAPPISL